MAVLRTIIPQPSRITNEPYKLTVSLFGKFNMIERASFWTTWALDSASPNAAADFTAGQLSFQQTWKVQSRTQTNGQCVSRSPNSLLRISCLVQGAWKNCCLPKGTPAKNKNWAESSRRSASLLRLMLSASPIFPTAKAAWAQAQCRTQCPQWHFNPPMTQTPRTNLDHCALK